MVPVLMTKTSDELRSVHYASTSTSTSHTPMPEEMAKVYSIQRRQLEALPIDWEAEAAVWGDDTRAWTEEAQQAGDEAIS
jgi:hypothetical protein